MECQHFPCAQHISVVFAFVLAVVVAIAVA
jgi:hypothetical protein